MGTFSDAINRMNAAAQQEQVPAADQPFQTQFPSIFNNPGNVDTFHRPGFQQFGFDEIFKILQGQGQIPKQQLNQQITQSNRAGQGVQQGIQGEAARRGLQNSGLFQALQAASGQATAGREANLRAGFSTDAANRQRQDLISLLLPLFNAQLDERAIREGVQQSNQARRQGRDAADQSAIGSLLGTVGGSIFGGPVGGAIGSQVGGRLFSSLGF